tara:strand:- start:328 stop:594 length:267 start_codon:yes stop_codon:yes gene_type:complete
MIVNKQQNKAGTDMSEINDIVKNMISSQVEIAIENPDNYDNDNNIIDDYVAADVHIAMANDNWENIDNMINEVLKEHDIYETTIKRVA